MMLLEPRTVHTKYLNEPRCEVAEIQIQVWSEVGWGDNVGALSLAVRSKILLCSNIIYTRNCNIKQQLSAVL